MTDAAAPAPRGRPVRAREDGEVRASQRASVESPSRCPGRAVSQRWRDDEYVVVPAYATGAERDGPPGYTYAAIVLRPQGGLLAALREIRFSGWLAPPEDGWQIVVPASGAGTVAAGRRGVAGVAEWLATRMIGPVLALRVVLDRQLALVVWADGEETGRYISDPSKEPAVDDDLLDEPVGAEAAYAIAAACDHPDAADDLVDLLSEQLDPESVGWWPAGALLARVLADYHRARGENAGIVTPYGRQVDATLEALRDHEAHGSALAEVGTAHRFQGRQFPIVIFDTVEDEYGDRWMANANRTGDTFRRDGIRLFNVAVTRAQHRLYLIGSRKKIEAAKAGTPFGHLAAMIRQQRARVVRANRLVTPTSTPDDELTRLAATFTGELAELLAEHVRVTDIHDERTFYEALDGHLTTAERSIWLWAPWTTTRVKQMVPLLRDAVDRGVWVTLFVRDPGDQVQRKPAHQQFLADLRSVLQSVVEVNVMHQKILVIDEKTVVLGSLNVLSQSWTREVMVTMRGAHFARKLLQHEHAKDFSRPPACGACGLRKVDLRRRRNGRWYWRCYSEQCPRWSANGRSGWTQDIVFSAAA